jgi:hypothetical protein
MYPVLKIMHVLNFLDTFSVGVTELESKKNIQTCTEARKRNNIYFFI